MAPSADYSNYIVFADESGDHSVDFINERYPLFVLAFCIFEKKHYIEKVSPALNLLKMQTFGHDLIVLHEYEIRKKTGAFNKLGQVPRENLLTTLSNLISGMAITLIPIVIDKNSLKRIGITNNHIYHLAVQLGLEKIQQFLQQYNQHEKITHIIFEARGKCEDAALELEFRRICDGQNSFKSKFPFEIVLADKKSNSAGLQLADLAARPIGLSVLRPNQQNHAFSVLEKKLYQEKDKAREPFVFPLKAKGPEVVLEAQAPVR